MGLTIYGIAASRAVRPLWAATELGLAFEHVHTPYQGGRHPHARVSGAQPQRPHSHAGGPPA